KGMPYQVIGVLEKQGSVFGLSLDRVAIAPYNSPLHHFTNPRGDVDGIMVQTPTALTMDDAMESVREVMRGRRKLRPSEPDNFFMETSASALAFMDKLKKVMTMAGTAFPAIGLIVGGLVIMNIMLVAVAERTHEIGIRKSLGARRRDIMRQFLVEAATLSTLGAVIGIVLGMAVDSIRSNKVRAALTIMGVAIGVFVVVAMSSVVRGINESFARDLEAAGPTSFYMYRRPISGFEACDGSDETCPERRNPALTIDDAEAIQRLPTIKAVTAHLGSGAKFTYKDKQVSTGMEIYTPNW